MNENLLNKISESIGALQAHYETLYEMNKGQLVKLDRIEAQTTKTNGRVTRLEDYNKTQLEINSRIEGLYKATQENLKLQLDNMEDKTKRCIDEFKKQDVEVIKIDKENGGRIKLAIISSASAIAILVVTWLLNK